MAELSEEVPLYTHQEEAREADANFRLLRGGSAINYVLVEKGAVVYVGITCYPHLRFRQHRHPWLCEVWERRRALQMVIVGIASTSMCRRVQTDVMRYNEQDQIAAYRAKGVELANQTGGGERNDWSAYWNKCECPTCAPWT